MLENKSTYLLNDTQAGSVHEQAAQHIVQVINNVCQKAKKTA